LSIRIAETFDVAVAPDLVFEYLLEPARIVHCLPGAELLEASGDGAFTGRIKVKVGPVSVAYRGSARFDEIDRVARRVRMSGAGQETGGAGRAGMTMMSEVIPLPDGGSRVSVESDVDVAGRIVQFGRGMIEDVSKQIFVRFADCVRATLEAEHPAAAPAVAAAAAGRPAAPRGISGSAPILGEPAAAEDAARARPAKTAPPAAQAPLRILPLLFRALRSRLARLFGR
jgi:uncharacterized protein